MWDKIRLYVKVIERVFGSRSGGEEAHCQDHCIAEDFYQVLMHESHISGPKET